ncbi:MAG: hypothetical protein R3F17_15745 [Planctomycetota bacterium]
MRTVRDWAALRQAAFDQAWRQMRDRFYDERMNGRDWQRIRARYRPVAAECIGAVEFTHLVNMMLGELNASHMGHNMGPDPLPESKPVDDWQPSTYELGLRFALRDAGPGLLVDSVIPGSLDRGRSAESGRRTGAHSHRWHARRPRCRYRSKTPDPRRRARHGAARHRCTSGADAT